MQRCRWRALAPMTACLMAGAPGLAWAAPVNPDPREARLEALEQEVRALAADNEKLQAQDAALAAKASQLESEVAALRQGQATQTPALASEAATIQTVEAKAPAPPSVVTKILNGRPIFASADGQFSATFHSIVQLDAAAYLQRAPGPTNVDFRRDGPALGATAANVDAAHARKLKDGTDFRRARLGFDGTAFGDWDYRILFDFGGPSSGVEDAGQLYETFVQYNGFKPLRLKVGAYPPPIGLEDQASTSGMPFIERSAIEDMARGFAAGDTRLAAQAWGYGDRWFADFAVTGRTIGVINTGTAAATPPSFGDQLAFVGRLAGTPFHGKDWLVHLGVHGSWLEHPPNTAGPAANGVTLLSAEAVSFSNTAQLRVDGTKFINTGAIDARHGYTAGLEAALQKGPLLVQGEAEEFGVERSDIASSPTFHGWYVEGLWTLTGEPRTYNRQSAAFDAPVPKHPFSLSGGGWGAWEIGARFADADLNYRPGAPGSAPGPTSIRGGEEQNVSVDLNWFPNPVVKFMLDYEHVKISRLSPNAALYATPAGAQIGQTYDAVAVRSQFAF